MMDYKKEYIKMAKKYEKLHDKLYERDFFEVEPAGEYTEDSSCLISIKFPNIEEFLQNHPFFKKPNRVY